MSDAPKTAGGPECDHLHLRYWASSIELRDTFTPSEASPGIMARRPGGGVWCPLCMTHWGHPRQPTIELDAVPSLPLESGAWAVFVMPDGSLQVEAGGALTLQEAEDLADALRMARRAAAARQDEVADRHRWRVDQIKGSLVLSRWDAGQQRALCLGQIIPRKACTCYLCEAAIPRGCLAWKGLPDHPPLPVRAIDGAEATRVCAACVERLTVAEVPAPEPPRAWPMRGTES